MAEFEAGVPRHYENHQVIIRKTPEIRLAYIRRMGAYYLDRNEGECTFDRLIAWAKSRGLWRDDSTIMGVCPDNSAVTPPQYCQYDVGLVVEDGVRADEQVCIQTLPEMTMAIMETRGSAKTGRAAWRYMISQWLPASGLERANHDYFEITMPDRDGKISYQSPVMLCIPVIAREPMIEQIDPGRQFSV